MDRAEDSIQAGSLCLLLASRPEAKLSSEWSDLASFSNYSLLTFVQSSHHELFSSLVQLSRSYIGQRTTERRILRADVKLLRNALVVRVYLSPWIGPTVQLKKATRQQLHQVMNSLLSRWTWEDDETCQGGEDLVFGNTVCYPF